jgi:hypothetical protein
VYFDLIGVEFGGCNTRVVWLFLIATYYVTKQFLLNNKLNIMANYYRAVNYMSN